MRSCCISNCENHIYGSSETVNYFKFPLHDNNLLQKWLAVIGQRNLQPDENTYICESHFLEKALEYNPKKRSVLLKPNAVPSIIKKQSNNGKIWMGKPARVFVGDVPKTQYEPPTISTRFRPILPKLEIDNGPTCQTMLKPTSSQVVPKNENPASAASNAYYILIPPSNDTKPLVTENPSPLPSTQNSILRINVTKIFRPPNEQSHIQSKPKIVDNEMENEERKEDKLTEEVVVYNKSLRRTVVFRLDRKTGKISVSRTDDPPEFKKPVAKKKNKLNKRVIRSRKRINIAKKPTKPASILKNKPEKKAETDCDVVRVPESLAEVNESYERAQQDRSAFKTRLRALREKFRLEQLAVEKLENEWSAIARDKLGKRILSNDEVEGRRKRIFVNKEDKVTKGVCKNSPEATNRSSESFSTDDVLQVLLSDASIQSTLECPKADVPDEIEKIQHEEFEKRDNVTSKALQLSYLGSLGLFAKCLDNSNEN